MQSGFGSQRSRGLDHKVRYRTGKVDTREAGQTSQKTRPSAGGTTTHATERTACRAPWLVCHDQEETNEERVVRTTRKRARNGEVGRSSQCKLSPIGHKYQT